MKLAGEIKYSISLLIGFFLVFALIFIQYPLNHSFIGNIDVWFYVWQWNDYIDHLLHNELFGQILYPDENFRGLVDSSIGYGAIFIIFKLIIKNDIWTFYMALVTIMALNCFSFTLILKQFGIQLKIAVVMAFCLFANNYVLSNLENFNAYTFFPAFLSIYFMIKGMSLDNPKKTIYLIISGLLAGIQVYYSIYLFLFQFILVLPVFIYLFYKSKKVTQYIPYALIMGVVIIPFFSGEHEFSDYLKIPELQRMLFYSNESHSIFFIKDWFRVSKGNLLYPSMSDINNPWRYGARSAFFGFSTYLLAILSVYYFYKKRQIHILLIIGSALLLGMLVSTGPLLRTDYYEIRTPLGWINKWFPDTLVIRHLFRAHIVTIALTLFLIGYYLQNIFLSKSKALHIFLIIFVAIFIFENVPFKNPKYQSNKYVKPPKELIQALTNVPVHSNLFFLPSCHIILLESELVESINPLTREYFYMVWKNNLPYNLFNGRMGYLTNKSYDNSLLTCNMNPSNYDQLIAENDIDYFVVIKEFEDQEFKDNFYPILKSKATKVSSNKSVEIYKP